MKKCTKCGILKPLDEFNINKKGKFGKESQCKECRKIYSKEYYRKHIDKKKRYYQDNCEEIKESVKNYRYKNGGQSMQDNKNCPAFLGVFIGERLCRHLFNDVQVMPNNNVGYDIICNKGKLIDVKTSCIFLNHGKNPQWTFKIRKNTTCDYFILISLDNRTDLNLLHMWMIPANKINHRVSVSISPSTIHKWDKWKRDINDAKLCCMGMKV